LYIVNFVFIFFDLQVCFILRFKRKSKRATNASKIIIDEREAKNNAREAKRTKVDARVDAKATTTTTIATIATNKKQLLKLRKQFACTHISLVFEIASILLNCLLLFNNSQKCINNTLYS